MPPSSSRSPSASDAAGVLKTVEINMGDDLGRFEVKVYADGFVVRSLGGGGNVVEISNIGKAVVLVRDSMTEEVSSRSIVGNSSSNSVTYCTVVVRGGGRGPSFQAACSVANFGPPPSTWGTPPSLPLVVPDFDDAKMCHPPPTTSTAPPPQEKKWWRWGSPAPPPPPSPVLPLEGRVVLVERGGCLFEEKAVLSQSLGAGGVVVTNNEEVVFIMAGKKDVQAEAATSTSTLKKKRKNKLMVGSPSPQQESSSSPPPVEIPAVMVTRSDGQRIRDAAAMGGAAEVSIHVTNIHMLTNSGRLLVIYIYNIYCMYVCLLSEFFGNLQYPKMWMKPNLVFVISRGTWGTFMTSSNGKEWQLYLMAKTDMESIHVAPASEIRTLRMDGKKGEIKSCSSSVLSNPVELYSYFLSRRCPDIFSVDLMSDEISLKRRNRLSG